MKRFIVPLLALVLGLALLFRWSERHAQLEAKRAVPVPAADSAPPAHPAEHSERADPSPVASAAEDGQKVEVGDLWSRGTSRTVSLADYERDRERKADRVKEVIAADIAAGLNAEVRQREAQLRE